MMSAEQGYEQNLVGQHSQDLHQNDKDIVNEISRNLNPTQASHQHTTNCGEGKCDVDHANHAGQTAIKKLSGDNCYQTTEFNEGSHISTTKN